MCAVEINTELSVVLTKASYHKSMSLSLYK